MTDLELEKIGTKTIFQPHDGPQYVLPMIRILDEVILKLVSLRLILTN